MRIYLSIAAAPPDCHTRAGLQKYPISMKIQGQKIMNFKAVHHPVSCLRCSALQ